MASVPASAEPGEATPAPPDEPPARRGRPSRRVLIAIAAILAIGGRARGRRASPRAARRSPRSSVATSGSIASGVVDKAIEDERSAPATSAVVYQQILPSLVQIQTSSPVGERRRRRVRHRSHRQRERSDPHRPPRGRRRDDDPAVLRRRHAVERPIVSTDPANDIAVLLPDRPPKPIVPAVLGGVGQIGDEAYAVGHPLGFVGSLTSGVISGLDRTVEAPDGKRLRGLIQFDAAVNPGNSGGPLLNRRRPGDRDRHRPRQPVA